MLQDVSHAQPKITLGPTGSTPETSAPTPPPSVAATFRVELAQAGKALAGRALRLTRNAVEAQDLVQETLLRALRFESSYQPGTNLKAWLNQVMFSVFVTRCRKLKRERRALDALTFDPCAWTHRDAAPVSQGLTRSVQGALDAIPPQFAQAVALVDIEEQSYKDAATRLGVPVGTVMSRLFRGRRLLAALLIEDAQDSASEPALCAA